MELSNYCCTLFSCCGCGCCCWWRGGGQQQWSSVIIVVLCLAAAAAAAVAGGGVVASSNGAQSFPPIANSTSYSAAQTQVPAIFSLMTTFQQIYFLCSSCTVIASILHSAFILQNILRLLSLLENKVG
jgi:hypothetical protein